MSYLKKPKKFYTNAERLKHLEGLMRSLRVGDDAAWRKQAWEWLTTGVFSREDFEKLLDLVADEAASEAAAQCSADS